MVHGNSFISFAGWSISNPELVHSLNVSVMDNQPVSVRVFSDRYYFLGQQNDSIFQRNVSDSFNISSGTGATTSTSVSAQDISPEGFIVNPTGTKLYVSGSQNESIYEYNITAFDVTTKIFVQALPLSAQLTNTRGMFLSNIGEILLVTGVPTSIFQWNLTIADDISSAVFSQSLASGESVPESPFLHPDGISVYLGSNSEDIRQWNLNTANSISTGVFFQLFNSSSQLFNLHGMHINETGKYLYLVGIGADTIFQYLL